MTFIGERDKVGMILFDFEACAKKELCPLLRGGAFPYGATNILRGGTPTLSHFSHLSSIGVVGHLAALTLHLAASFLHLAALSCPLAALSSLGDFHLWLFIKVLSHCNLVGVWGLLLVVVYYCNTFHLE